MDRSNLESTICLQSLEVWLLQISLVRAPSMRPFGIGNGSWFAPHYGRTRVTSFGRLRSCGSAAATCIGCSLSCKSERQISRSAPHRPTADGEPSFQPQLTAGACASILCSPDANAKTLYQAMQFGPGASRNRAPVAHVTDVGFQCRQLWIFLLSRVESGGCSAQWRALLRCRVRHTGHPHFTKRRSRFQLDQRELPYS